jgi:hypothetical protein
VPDEALCAYMAPMRAVLSAPVGQRGMKPSCLFLTFK